MRATEKKSMQAAIEEARTLHLSSVGRGGFTCLVITNYTDDLNLSGDWFNDRSKLKKRKLNHEAIIRRAATDFVNINCPVAYLAEAKEQVGDNGVFLHRMIGLMEGDSDPEWDKPLWKIRLKWLDFLKEWVENQPITQE